MQPYVGVDEMHTMKSYRGIYRTFMPSICTPIRTSTLPSREKQPPLNLQLARGLQVRTLTQNFYS